jgi:hypothetical protein
MLLASAASAQVVAPTWPLDSGTVIRVTSVGSNFRRGTLTSTTSDSITIDRPRVGRFAVGLDQVRNVEVLTESHTEKAKYTLIGLLVGAGAGALIGAVTYSPSKCDASVSFCLDVFDRSATTAIGALVFGAAGGLVGLMAGAAPKETWVSVPVPSR